MSKSQSHESDNDVYQPWYGNGTGLRSRDLLDLAVNFASDYVEEFDKVKKLEKVQERRFTVTQRNFGDFLAKYGALVENPYSMIDEHGDLLPRSDHKRRGLMQRMSQIRLAMNDLTKVGAHGLPVFSIETPPSRMGQRKVGREKLIIKLMEPIVKDHLPRGLLRAAQLIDNTIKAGKRFIQEASAKEDVFDEALLAALKKHETEVYTTMANAVYLFQKTFEKVEEWQNKQLHLMKQVRQKAIEAPKGPKGPKDPPKRPKLTLPTGD